MVNNGRAPTKGVSVLGGPRAAHRSVPKFPRMHINVLRCLMWLRIAGGYHAAPLPQAPTGAPRSKAKP